MKKSFICSLSMAVWLAMPFAVSAAWLPYSGDGWIDRPSNEQGSLERSQLLHKVADMLNSHLGAPAGPSYGAVPGQRPDSGKPDTSNLNVKGGNQSMNQPYGYPTDSLKGHSGGPNMWPGSRAESDPMVRGLSEMNSSVLHPSGAGSSLGR